jgi:hypothetical protein
MQTISYFPKNIQDPILIYNFAGFSTFMLKDGNLWIRLTDIWSFLSDTQRKFLLSSGVGLCDVPDNSFNGEYVKYDSFISCASSRAKPMLRQIKQRVLGVMAQDGKQ